MSPTQTATPEERHNNRSGVRIFTRIWRPVAPARAIVAICHGFNSHSGHYFWVAEQLVQAGFAVYALDLRGRGLSEGERFMVGDVQEYVSDLSAMIDQALEREGALPVFLLGHSAGGVVSCIYALDNPSRLAGLICESFAFKVPAPDIVLSLVKGLSRLFPRLRVLTLNNADFSRDPTVAAMLNADPLIAGESQPARTVAAMARANDRLKRQFGSMSLPLLILHGENDKVTLPAGSRVFGQQAGSTDKQLSIYPQRAHDLLNDLGKEQVLGDIRNWIDKRLG